MLTTEVTEPERHTHMYSFGYITKKLFSHTTPHTKHSDIAAKDKRFHIETWFRASMHTSGAFSAENYLENWRRTAQTADFRESHKTGLNFRRALGETKHWDNGYRALCELSLCTCDQNSTNTHWNFRVSAGIPKKDRIAVRSKKATFFQLKTAIATSVNRTDLYTPMSIAFWHYIFGNYV